ncbi:MAG: hypothetical protein HC860_26865 [Alkalinema sp. RU_4_3]|nr:hypothetical protein [Alkalinema sp. RU_4_3]
MPKGKNTTVTSDQNWGILGANLICGASMEFDDSATLVCVGKFDAKGLPLVMSRHLSQQATVTFQALSLDALLSEALQQEQIEGLLIHSKDGTSIRVDRNHEGFIAYLEQTHSGEN